MKFLSYDSPFMTRYRQLVDYILLGLLWILASVPIVTFGAATTAALLTAEISLRKDEGTVFKTFWKHFRKEFKEATILWLIQLPLLMVLSTNLWLMSTDLLPVILELIILAASVVVFCWMQLWLAYLSKFEDNVRTVLGNTFSMTIANFGKVFLMAALIAVTFIAIGILLWRLPPLLLLVPGVFILFYTELMRKLFDRYIPDNEPEIPDEAE